MSHDHDPTLRLLWRHQSALADDAPLKRGPRQRLSIDEVVDAAIEIADRSRLDALSMRTLARKVGLSTMSLYNYVPGRTELIVLMVDQVLGRRELPTMPKGIRERLELIVRVEHADCTEHPWLLDATQFRPWLGPHSSDRYEWQLSAVDQLGLTDIEMDQTVALLVGFARNMARAAHDVQQAQLTSGMTELEWWQANAEELARVMAGREYPLGSRVGTAAGEMYQAANDPARELEFGLARITDGIVAHIDDKVAEPISARASTRPDLT